MRYWLLKIIEVLDTINEGLAPVTPEEPEVTPSVSSTRSIKKDGGKKK